MNILVTGAKGFIGKNLCVHLREKDHTVFEISRDSSSADIESAIGKADFIFHLAGVNRPENDADFKRGNADFTADLLERISGQGRALPVVLSSSTQVSRENPYGESKRQAEIHVENYGKSSGAKTYIYRLTNVFGKWSKPNYNSFVSTFCHNISRGLPIQINDPSAPVTLVYIDDVCAAFMSHLDSEKEAGYHEVSPVYDTTVGEVADLLKAFRESRETLISERVGTGLIRALYSTYLSYFEPSAFSYEVPVYGDARGEFSEILKTKDTGQISFFTAHPGITRGQHYHHSKNEKFLVIQGKARFLFKHIVTGETHEIITSNAKKEIVETVPGWTHDITNIGDDLMICVLWANEIFDRDNPDTIAMSTR